MSASSAEESLARFRAIPWCKKTLDSQPDLQLSPPRAPDHPTHNPFWWATVVNDGSDTIKDHCLLYQPLPSPSNTSSSNPSSKPISSMKTTEFFSIGSKVIGQHGICHGGFIASLLDEVTGALCRLYHLDDGIDPRTAYLNTTYKKAVRAPGVIRTTSEVALVERRKILLRATIYDEVGDVCVIGEVLYIIMLTKPVL